MKQIALTFDDGPSIGITDQILEKLHNYHIVASFFVIGDKISDSTSYLLKQAFESGCEIQNHSRTHSNMTQLTKEDILTEINTTSNKIYDVVGVKPTFFRPPYIALNANMFDTIHLPMIAGIGAQDWEPNVTSEQRATMILEHACDGAIILLHDMDGNQYTVDALDLIIPGLLQQGYEFVTISDLFAQKKVIPNTTKNVIYSNVLYPTYY